jgi:hypothetical protein
MAETDRHPESADVWPRALLFFVGGLLVFIAASALVLQLIFDTKPFPELPTPADTGNAASPALQRHPEADLTALRRKEAKDLSALRWVDRTNGIAQIPIVDAMRLLAKHGLPDWAAGERRANCGPVAKAAPRAPQARDCDTAAPGKGLRQ